MFPMMLEQYDKMADAVLALCGPSDTQKAHHQRLKAKAAKAGGTMMAEKKPERYSAEWIAAMERMHEALSKLLVNNKDTAAWDQFIESGEKIGWVVPMDVKDAKVGRS
jgi:hypothetical protein